VLIGVRGPLQLACYQHSSASVQVPGQLCGLAVGFAGHVEREDLASRSNFGEPQREADVLRAVVRKAGDRVPFEDAGQGAVVQVHNASSARHAAQKPGLSVSRPHAQKQNSW
jgi:hypothetical protein